MKVAISDKILSIQSAVRAVIGDVSHRDLQDSFDHQVICAALERHNGNQCRAAADLGWHRNTLSRRVAILRERGYQFVLLKKDNRTGYKMPRRNQYA